MGTDIHGFIECRWDRWLDEDDRSWFGAIDLAHLYNGRCYVAFGSLFGVRDTTSFRALADHRGLPHDVSKEVLADFEPWSDELHGESWISWAELAGADWDEVANEVDGCVHEYRRSSDGSWKMHGRNSSLSRFAELSGLTDARQLYCAGSVYPEHTEWPDGDRLFRIGRLQRKHAVPDNEMGLYLVGHAHAGEPARRRGSPPGRLVRRLTPTRPELDGRLRQEAMAHGDEGENDIRSSTGRSLLPPAPQPRHPRRTAQIRGGPPHPYGLLPATGRRASPNTLSNCVGESMGCVQGRSPGFTGGWPPLGLRLWVSHERP
ncbi:hypothetical protein OIE61_30320 [Streptomyces sp. NBC_01762]|uniref:hypothetical protein n=1 Tax=unclassified Streptomyces TaxID=2593676 RepID=UPI002DD87856|nr:MULTISPECIES: hypothetical protein [unclassified Streptomyces]WSC47917.1 hypothetical protein OIE61_30320 [Streptomyces sp. NBC_01762]WSD27568.1 hypothetical protein OHA26_31035 [Streptomyces sp. NBC_01751]